MTAHNHNHQEDLQSIAPTAAFDEVFAADDRSPTMDKHAGSKHAKRLVSVPYDEPAPRRAATMETAPLSPCATAETSASMAPNSITGQFRNIESRYHVDPRVLGTGHHGSVRECVDRLTGDKHAVKSVRKTDPRVKPGQLAREITLLRQVNHRNIIELVDVYEDAHYVHIITGLCAGGELFDRIAERSVHAEVGAPCFSEEEAARILHQILTAISYLHRMKLVHRDIKPENLLFETKEEGSPIRLCDFGLSRIHDEATEPPMTTLLGTPYYIAPEVLTKGYDKSCDLWSVGVIAFTLMAGYPPFNGGSNEEIHAAVLRGKYRFSATDWSETSREVRDFVRRLLQKDPKRRMTADEALRHPWMVRHVGSTVEDAAMGDAEESRQDDASVEVVFRGATERDAILLSERPAKGKRRVKARIPFLYLSGNR